MAGFAALPFAMKALTVIAAGGAVLEGFDQKQQADAQADIEDIKARRAVQQAEIEAAKIAEEGRRTQASQQAAYGANGLMLQGTPTQVMIRDAMTTEMNVSRREIAGKMAFQSHKFQAKQFEQAGRRALAIGAIKAGTTVLTASAMGSQLGSANPSTATVTDLGSADLGGGQVLKMGTV